MLNLAKMGFSLLIVSAVSLIPRVSLAANRDFNLSFSSNSKISTVRSNAVVRGDRDRYYFSAQGGQRISIAVASLEDNAVFQLLYKRGEAWVAVEGTQEGRDRRVWYGVLPSSDSNRYRIDVGGTRGNASYDLFVGIAAVRR